MKIARAGYVFERIADIAKKHAAGYDDHAMALGDDGLAVNLVIHFKEHTREVNLIAERAILGWSDIRAKIYDLPTGTCDLIFTANPDARYFVNFE